MLPDLLPEHWRPQVKRFLLDLDARLNATAFASAVLLREFWERYSIFMYCLRVGGWRRVIVESCSESVTLLAVALLLLRTLASPALHETSVGNLLRKPELSITFLDRYGNEIGSRGIHHDDSVPLEQLPDYLVKAVLGTEDRRFYEHFGIDLPGALRALTADLHAGGVVQGGSSITQQLAKNLFLTNERTIQRKTEEAFLAIWLESRLSKNEILKLYLDRAYLGAGTYGIEAAAQHYFGKSARDVTLAEAAMLAGLLKAPARFSPDLNLPAARDRANVVLDNLIDAGFMKEAQLSEAHRNPATPIENANLQSASHDEKTADYYLDWAFEEIKKIVDTFPISVRGTTFVVRTAIDMDLQHATEHAVQTSLREYGRTYHVSQSAAVLMDVDGSVRTMVGGRDYAQSQFNRAVYAMRQPGSSFKPYVYTAALSDGLTPDSTVTDAPICIDDWCPQNYERSHGRLITLTRALAHSINTVAVRLSILIGHGNSKIGRAKIIETARKMGVHAPLPDVPSLPLGADEVTVLDQTAAYATFPNLGRAIIPHAILDVRTRNGRVVWRFDRDGPKPKQVISPQLATQMVSMMNQVVEEGTGKRAMLDGIPTAGKTGTTNSYRDAWFVGYTGNYVCGVWFGNDDHSATDRMTGGSLPAATWREIMTRAHQGIELKQLPGLPPPARPPAMQTMAKHKFATRSALSRSALLNKSGAGALQHLEHKLDDAGHTMPRQGQSTGSALNQEGPAPDFFRRAASTPED